MFRVAIFYVINIGMNCHDTNNLHCPVYVGHIIHYFSGLYCFGSLCWYAQIEKSSLMLFVETIAYAFDVEGGRVMIRMKEDGRCRNKAWVSWLIAICKLMMKGEAGSGSGQMPTSYLINPQ